MKNNVIYINFSYLYKKKKFFTLIEKLFNKNKKGVNPIPNYKPREVIRIQDFDKKRIL